MALIAGACGGDDGDSGGSANPDGDGPSTTEDAGTPVAGGEATILLYSEIGSLNPATFTGSGGAEGMRAFAAYGALVAYDDATKEVNPVLADSLEPNADFTVWTLKLKPGITFTDGTPYNAAAVKTNWEFRKDPAKRSPSFTPLMSVASLTAVDDTTLTIQLSAPNAHFDNSVSKTGLNYIASATAIQNGTDMTSTAIGAGPFTVESWLRDDRMVLKKNPNWKGSEGPYLDTLTLRTVSDEEQRIDTFATGQADAFYTATPLSVKNAEEQVDGAEYVSVDVTTGQSYVFNTSKAPFDDVRVRKAFVQAVDWDALADTVFGEGAEALTNFTLEGTPFYTDDAALPPYDPAAAQELIDEYVAEKGGPIKITMLSFQQSLDQARGKFIQTSLSQLDNLELEIQVNDSPTNIQKVLAGDYSTSSWGFPVVAPDPGVYNAADSKALTNYSKYKNAEVDALIAQARVSADDEANAELFQEVFAQLATDIPYYPYVKTTNGFVLSPELKGGAVYEDGILRFDLLWLKK
ncbi:MAG TPA: ABC transporter substrate-binding protein [Acidimicrobiia bacterium]|nr:ABC transporter substrate-binding protein [Acidimicrobiia bacterium]